MNNVGLHCGARQARTRSKIVFSADPDTGFCRRRRCGARGRRRGRGREWLGVFTRVSLFRRVPSASQRISGDFDGRAAAMLHGLSADPQLEVRPYATWTFVMLTALLLAACVIGAPCAADQYRCERCRRFTGAIKLCRASITTAMQLTGLIIVRIRWRFAGTTKQNAKLGCQDEVPANTRSAAAISRHARWCECPGSAR